MNMESSKLEASLVWANKMWFLLSNHRDINTVHKLTTLYPDSVKCHTKSSTHLFTCVVREMPIMNSNFMLLARSRSSMPKNNPRTMPIYTKT